MEDEKIPEWHSGISGRWVPDSLSQVQRERLINSKNGIFPRKFTLAEKNSLLDVVETGLAINDDAKDYLNNGGTPLDHKNNITDLLKSISTSKTKLCNLKGSALDRADKAFAEGRSPFQFNGFGYVPPFHMHLTESYGYQVDSLLIKTWLHLSDLEKVLTRAAENIHVDQKWRPSDHTYDTLVNHLIEVWVGKYKKYPPHSRTGWFAKFIVELGEVINQKFGLDMAGRCIKQRQQIYQSLLELKIESEKVQAVVK